MIKYRGRWERRLALPENNIYIGRSGIVFIDKERYPKGPWCKKGSWVIFARYAGSRMKIDGGEVRLLNDDEVLATVENPEDIFHEF